MSEPCTVCGSERTSFFHESRDKLGHREFIHCAACDAVFVPRRMHLGFPAQRERYLIHENDPFDQGYRDFLDRLLAELAPLLTPGSRGLDYGAGPGPALAMMMRERGFRMSIYDPIFHPDEVRSMGRTTSSPARRRSSTCPARQGTWTGSTHCWSREGG